MILSKMNHSFETKDFYYFEENLNEYIFKFLTIFIIYLHLSYVSFKFVMMKKMIYQTQKDTLMKVKRNNIINHFIIKGFVEHNNTRNESIVITQNNNIIDIKIAFHKKPWYYYINLYTIDFDKNKVEETNIVYSVYYHNRFEKNITDFLNNFDKFQVKDEYKYDKQIYQNTRCINHII